MRHLLLILLLAMAVTFALLFGAATALGIAKGQFKSEPARPWITFREHPIRFLRQLTFYLALTCFWIVLSVVTWRSLRC